MLRLDSDIAFLTFEGINYCSIIHGIKNTLSLMIVGIYKMHVKEINVKNRVCNYYSDNLIKSKKLETIRIWWFILLDIFTVNQLKCYVCVIIDYWKRLKNMKEKNI